MITTRTKKLGQILVDSGRVTEEQLELALREQKQTGEKLGAILQRLGVCSETDIAKVLSRQAGVSYIALAEEDIDPEAVAVVAPEFAERHCLLPVSLKENTLTVAMANPLNLEIIDRLGQLTGRYIEVVHATESSVQAALLRFHGANNDMDDQLQEAIAAARKAVDEGASVGGEADSPYVRLVNLLLRKAVDDGATDIHVEPEEKVVRTRYRIDGRLVQGPFLPNDLRSVVTTRLKIMASMNISNTRVPQDGRIQYKIGSRTLDMRVSSFPTVHGETVVCRVLDKQNLVLGLEHLGMHEDMLQQIQDDITRPNGIVLVTGPTGSGKTTTLYSALTSISNPDTKIITLEDPVEYELPGITQAHVKTEQGFTFASGLRAILRQDPDVILVGEIRDSETAALAIRAALTGHMVFSTLHTNTAVGAIPRLLDMGVQPYLLSATLLGVLAQRLIRQNCKHCSQPYKPTVEEARLLELEADARQGALASSTGCVECRQTGYTGRAAVFEYFRVTPDLREMITDGQAAAVIEAAARKQGMRTLRDDTFDQLMDGRTSVSEAIRIRT